jgi:hypothetical protein
VLRRLVKASAIVIGVGLIVTGCAVTPVKMGAAAIVGNQRISIATLDTEVTNLSQAAKQYPGVVTLTATQETQATLSWLIRYQINEKLAQQQGITISPAQAQAALNQAYASAKTAAAQQGLTNPSLNLILAARRPRRSTSRSTPSSGSWITPGIRSSPCPRRCPGPKGRSRRRPR